MPALTIPDLPEPVYRRLRERADRHRRSLDAEAAALIEAALPPPMSEDGPFIAEAEAAHALFPEPLPDLIAEGKRAGRKYEDDLPPHMKIEAPIEDDRDGVGPTDDHAGGR